MNPGNEAAKAPNEVTSQPRTRRVGPMDWATVLVPARSMQPTGVHREQSAHRDVPSAMSGAWPYSFSTGRTGQSELQNPPRRAASHPLPNATTATATMVTASGGPLVLKRNLRAGTITNSSTIPTADAARVDHAPSARTVPRAPVNALSVARGHTFRHNIGFTRNTAGSRGIVMSQRTCRACAGLTRRAARSASVAASPTACATRQ